MKITKIKTAIITALTTLTTLIKSNKSTVKRSYRIHPNETLFFNFREAFIENSKKKIEIDYSWQAPKNYIYKPITITNTKIPFEKPSIIQKDQIKEYGILGSSLSSTGLWWYAKMMYYNLTNNNKFIEFGDIKRYKSTDIQHPKTLYKMDFKKENYLCEKFYYLTELDVSLFVCKAIDNRWFLLLRCSDQSCNDRSQILKVSENRRDKSSKIKVKIMPGYSRKSITLFVYFQNDVLLETININSDGGYNSEIHIMQQKLDQIFYFSGQIIVFKCFTSVVGSYAYFFKIHDFATKYDLNSWNKMAEFGKFLNSYNTKESSDLMIEFYDKRFNIIALKYSRDTKQFTIESSIDMRNENIFTNLTRTFIFEIAEYQLIMNQNPDPSDENNPKVYYSLAYKGQNLELEDTEKKFFFENKFSKISGTGELSSIRFDKKNVDKTVLKRIKFERPILIVEGKSLKLIKNLRALEKMINFDTTEERERSYFWRKLQSVEKKEKVRIKTGNDIHFEIDYTFTNKELGTSWWMDKITMDKGVPVYKVKSRSLSDLVVKTHLLIRGSFLVVSKFQAVERDHNNKEIIIEYKNEINPLFTYFNLESTGEIKKSLFKCQNLIGFIHRGRNAERFLLFMHNPSDFNTTHFEVQNKKIKKIRERSLLVDSSKYIIFNETILIAQGKNNLWFIDTENKAKKIKEMMFERGQCQEFMLIRHSKLDVSFWCHSKNKLQAYYARELLSGKVGLSKIPVEYNNNIPFDKFKYIYNSFFQDYFYCMDKNFTLWVFKIDATLYLNVILVKKIDLGLKIVKNQVRLNNLLDFKFVEDKLLLYTDEKIGWDRRIVLHFYHFEIATAPKLMKTVNLDYNFSPDPKDKNLYPFQSTRTNIYKEKYLFMPMFAIKVVHNLKFDNVIFINPQVEYHQSVPSVLFPMSSKLKINLGSMVTTSNEVFSYSLIVAYQNITEKKENQEKEPIKFSVVEPDQLKLRLFEGKSTDIFDIYSGLESMKAKEIFFEKFNSSDPNLRKEGLKLVIEYPKKEEGNSNQLVVFNKKISQLNLNDYKFSSSIMNHNPILHKIEVFDLLNGHSFRFSLKAESELELVSKVIELERLVENVPSSIPGDFSRIIPKEKNETCSKPLRIEIKSLYRNITDINKKWSYVTEDNKILEVNHLLYEEFQIWVCSGDRFPVLNVRKLWRNMTLHILKFRNILGNIFSTDFGQIELEFFNNVLSINVKSQSSDRIIYNDIYFLDIFSIFNKTASKRIKVHEKIPKDVNLIEIEMENLRIKEMKKKLKNSCFSEHMNSEKKHEKAKRISECKTSHEDLIEYKIHLLFLKRENFRLDQTDFLLRTKYEIGEIPDKNDPKKTIKKEILKVDFVIFGLKKNIYSEYILEMLVDKIKVDYKTTKNLRKFIEKKAHMIKFKIDKDFSSKNNIDIYQDIKYKIINKKNKDIWILIENPSASNVILRYPPSILKEADVDKSDGKESKTKPFAWILENPYFSKVSGANVVSKFRDWLYILPKIVSEEAHFIVYILPKGKLVRYLDGEKRERAEQIYRKPVYSTTIYVMKNVVDYQIKNVDFSAYICKFV